MKVAFVINARLSHQGEWFQHLAEGLKRHGDEAIYCSAESAPRSADAVVRWSAHDKKLIAGCRANGTPIVIFERGFIDRMNYSSLQVGGELNGRATMPEAQDDGKRFATLFGHLRRPWHDGRVALICAQVPGDAALRDLPNPGGFYARVVEAVRARGFEPVFRPHPQRAMPAPKGVRIDTGPLDEALARAGLVVTWNSNSAVDAILAGVPVVCADEGCMAWPVSVHWPDVRPVRPVRPSRCEWLAELAWKQWSRDELASGLAWGAVRELIH